MPIGDTWRRATAAGRCPQCSASVPTAGRYFAWQGRVCPTCGAMVRNAMAGRIAGAGLMFLAVLGIFLVPRGGWKPVLMVPQLAALFIILATAYRMRLVSRGPYCPHCHYDISTSPDAACPECGRTPPWRSRMCPSCPYELTGLPPGAPCPECGAKPHAQEARA